MKKTMVTYTGGLDTDLDKHLEAYFEKKGMKRTDSGMGLAGEQCGVRDLIFRENEV